jgi:arabinofuranan 3-O-arabinosyltransferase
VTLQRAGRLALWTFAGLVVVLRVVQARSAFVWSDDFTVYWHAGRAVLDGADPWVPGFVYLPGSVVAFLGPGLLPEGIAAGVWLAASVLAVLVAAVLVAWWNRLPVPVVVAGTFLAFPTESALQFGNVTAFQLLLLVASVAAARRGAWGQVALWLGIGIALKPVLVPCLLILLLHRRWRALMIALAVPLGASAAVLLAVGDVRGWVDAVRRGLDVAAADPASADVGSLADRLGLSGVPRTSAWLLVAVLVVAAAVLVLVRSRRPVVWLLVPLLPVLLLGSPSWAHYPLLLLPLVGALVAAGGVPRVLAGTGVVAWVLPEPVSGAVLRAVPPADVFGLFTLGTVLVFAAAVAEAVRPRAVVGPLPTT